MQLNTSGETRTASQISARRFTGLVGLGMCALLVLWFIAIEHSYTLSGRVEGHGVEVDFDASPPAPSEPASPLSPGATCPLIQQEEEAQ
jgi:hypothetical protein